MTPFTPRKTLTALRFKYPFRLHFSKRYSAEAESQKNISQPDLYIKTPSTPNKHKRLLVILAVIVLLTLTLLTIAYALNSTPNIAPEAYHDELVLYALELINIDRAEHGLQNVTLSTINCAQLHAEDMLKNNYFSHWNQDGYTPDMRYTLSGGQGAVTENIAYSTGLTHRNFYNKAKTTLERLQYLMMYDDAEWDWGHRDNILNPLHNKVSIGIAYQDQCIYLVQDFEDDHITWDTFSVSDPNKMTLSGTTAQADYIPASLFVFYSNPSPLSVNQLENAPYNGSYNPGTLIATIVPPARSGYYYNWNNYPLDGIEAGIWSQTNTSFQINFSLTKTINNHQKGIYTLYLLSGSNTTDPLLTYSIWIT